MSLFPVSNNNLLPTDGVLRYISQFLTLIESDELFRKLHNELNWQPDVIKMYGKEIITARKVIWMSQNNLPYTYSGTLKQGIPFTEEIAFLKNKLEQYTNTKFNACLLNFYQNGKQAMGWHSDNESSIVPNSTIASISLGAERDFYFKHKQSNQKVSVFLENGSLCLMENQIQQYWLHQLPVRTKVLAPRINLTFRLMKT
jgi:alkylated DNA repair dioxygenase AlkB